MGLISAEYLAGYFDGEGCIQVQVSKKSKCYNLQIAISSTDYEPLKSIHDMFGGCFIFIQRNNKNSKWQDIWRWSVVSKDAYRFLLAIQPYVIIKKKEIDLAIEFHEYLQATKVGRKDSQSRWVALSVEQLEKRKWYKNTISSLKHRK